MISSSAMLEMMQETRHRPFPPPDTPWVFWQECRDVLFASWPVLPGEIRALVPAPLQLDLWQNQAWISVVPFDSTVKPRGMEARVVQFNFHEINVRTYVTYQGRPGVYFLSLDFDQRFPFQLAGPLFHLPIRHGEIAIEHVYGWVQAQERGDQQLSARYEPVTEAFNAKPGTFEHWLTERYCLFTVNGHGEVSIGHIHHRPWPLQLAEATIQWNRHPDLKDVRVFGQPSVLYCANQEMVAWKPYPCVQ